MAGIITDSPNFLPHHEIGSTPGAEYVVTSQGFAKGWVIKDIRIFGIRVPVLSGCDAVQPFCEERDTLREGRFTVSANINGSPFLESGPMHDVRVEHYRSFTGSELNEDWMKVEISWMRAYPMRDPSGGLVPLMLWLNPVGTLVARNVGYGLYDMTLDWTARTMLRSETLTSNWLDVEGPQIPLTFLVPEPGTFVLVTMAFVVFVWTRKSLRAYVAFGIAAASRFDALGRAFCERAEQIRTLPDGSSASNAGSCFVSAGAVSRRNCLMGVGEWQWQAG